MHGAQRLLVWLLPGSWMALIWRMSADAASGIKSLRIARLIWGRFLTPLTGLIPSHPMLSATDQIFRKACHIGEYGALALFFRIALAVHGRHDSRSAHRLAFLLTVAWAAVDELHQSVVPGRGGMLADVVVDAVGALLMLGTWRLIARRQPRTRSRPA